MLTALMPRKRTTITLDVEAIEAFKRLAKKANMSLPKYLEALMITHAKSEGEIPQSYEPLGETRGGNRGSSEIENG